MKKIYFVILLIGTFHLSYSQTEYSSFTTTGRGGATTFVTDYQAVGINPANLGWSWDFDGKKVAWGLSETSYSIYSEALKKADLRTMMRDIIKGDGENFTQAEKLDAAKNFTESGFSLNVDLGSFGFAFTHEKIGGIAFRINDRFQWNSTFSKEMSEILFLGFNAPYFDSVNFYNGSDTVTIANSQNFSQDTLDGILNGFANSPQFLSEIMNGSSMKMSWMREWNLSYGKKLFEVDSAFALYAGFGVKFFQGIGYLDVKSENNQLEAFSSMSPAFNIDYGSAATTNPSNVTDGSFFNKPVGHGFGFDIGLNAVLFNKLKIGAALTNIGSMTWDGNVYTVKDTVLYDTENAGLENYNIIGQMGDILGENGMFKYEGVASRTVKLPTNFRIGASMKFGKKIELGTDIIIPMNDEASNFNKAIIGFGGDVQPIKWLRLQAGFMTGGNYDFQIPVGITFIAKNGTYEAGFASRDAITFFSQNGPTLSLSMGFIRWRI